MIACQANLGKSKKIVKEHSITFLLDLRDHMKGRFHVPVFHE